MTTWKLIDKHRKKARQISFSILVWGPSDSDRVGYQLRLGIRDHLISKGHSAKFSEELIREGDVPAGPDPIVDEIFQADAADMIIVLYGSRGTQTEMDVILEYEAFARKSVVLLNESTRSIIETSLSGMNWRDFKGKISTIPDDKFDKSNICDTLDDLLEKLQFAEYIRRLKKRYV